MIGTQLRNCDFFSTIFVRDTIQIPLKGPWKVDLNNYENYYNSETNEYPKGMKKLSISPKGPIELKISLKPLLDRQKFSCCLLLVKML